MSKQYRCTPILGALAALAAVMILPAYAQHAGHEHGAGGKTITVTGELVDLSCYLGHGAKGAGHQKCADTCLKKGLPMGVLTKDGKLYLILEDHAKADAYASLKTKAAKTVTVTGALHEKDGIKGIAVTSAK